MKAIDKIGAYHWRKLSSQIPSEKQVKEIEDKVKDHNELVTTCSPCIFFAGHYFIVNSLVQLRAQPYHTLSDSHGKTCETYCANNPADIQNRFFELYYQIKTGYEPLRE